MQTEANIIINKIKFESDYIPEDTTAYSSYRCEDLKCST
jgi:hypothetical protein